NHGSHRAMACTACHEKAQTSTQTSDVLLPKADLCKQCHNPAAGVRSDCVTCHLYHDRTCEKRGLNGMLSARELVPGFGGK
ncbi:MAG TPA: hypothetical protein VKS79_05100, partial [Gemmataceae bacterium]|nr:hypothetical protein [Gemmataceae bacterium]